jgi:hypothetical protein
MIEIKQTVLITEGELRTNPSGKKINKTEDSTIN